MLGIGGTVCAGTFAFSLSSSRSYISRIHNLNDSYKGVLNISSSDINSVDRIEDFEQSKGCKFLFYNEANKGKAFREGSFNDSRNSGVELAKLVTEVKGAADKCVNGSYVFFNTSPATKK